MSSTLEPDADYSDSPVIERAVDVDSHEMVPPELRDGIFGPTALNDLISTIAHKHKDRPDATLGGVQGDETPISHETVWNLKGASAPSAIDLNRRPDVLDRMGIARQLVYPTFGLAALVMALDPFARQFFGVSDAVDCPKIGREAIGAHNRWAVETTRTSNQRVRPVGLILTDSVEGMVQQARDLIAAGIRALMIPANNPPGGTSPADAALDPFWAACAEADIPVTLHLGSERGFISSMNWSANVEVFKPSFKSTMEFNIEPLACATIHYAPENFVAAMVMGGVFERHPRLRFGVIELSAAWIGPLAERLDMWTTTMFASRFKWLLPLRPSEYIARNVRVTPFYFEPVDRYLERYPQLSDVYCYSTDYPHFEGGEDSKRVFAETLKGVSADLRDKFFYRNGSLLLPD
jgi:predicted TIM-barrel fold metal-dependent hydrolase